MLIGIGLGFTAQFTGVNAFMYYTPIILKHTGMGTNAALTATIGNGVVSVIATLLGIWAIARYGRRSLLMTGLTVVVLEQLALNEPQSIEEVLIIDAQARAAAHRQLKQLAVRG